MKKEAITINTTGAPEAYKDFITERNSNFAKILGEKILDVPFVSEAAAKGFAKAALYYVPSATIDGMLSEELGITSVDDFYGTKVATKDLVGKAYFHVSVSKDSASFHREDFAKDVMLHVLPGFAGFSKEDVLSGFEQNKTDAFDYRLKLPDESDGNGQYVIHTKEELAETLALLDPKFIKEHGIVLEANIEDPQTISAGTMFINGKQYSFLSYQKNDKATEKDPHTGKMITRDRYKGGRATVVRGGMENLYGISDITSKDKEAITHIKGFYDAYVKHTPSLVASRISFDYLYGKDKKGNDIGGVTDITGRLGGFCPALVLAVDKLQNDQSVILVQGESTLNYEAEKQLPEEKNATVFIDNPKLRITARINKMEGRVL